MIIDAPRVCHIPLLRELWKEAFGDTDAWLDTFFNTAFSLSRCRAVIENNEIIAALYWFDCEAYAQPVAYLYAIATKESHRGKGLCRLLMENTHKHLATLGYAFSILVPAEKSLFDFYRKMGYHAFSFVRYITAWAEGETAPLEQLSKEEYAARRRLFLPKGGVVQEKENLDFLSTQSTLYASKDCVFAARKEGDTLWITELLGSTALAGRIVSALGCQKGRFRTVGGEPFAMYHSLTNKDGKAPTYFGLAFD